jgi:hypothetical protein
MTQVSLMETESLRGAQQYVNRIELCVPPGRYNEWADGDDSAENQKVMLCVLTLCCFCVTGTLQASVQPHHQHLMVCSILQACFSPAGDVSCCVFQLLLCAQQAV